MNFNQVTLMGRLARDPQLKYLPNQTPIVEFGIASNRKFKASSGEEREEVLFVDCSAFGRIAEVINEHFRKGKPIFLCGRLRYDAWEDKQGGGKRSKLTVVVDTFQFIGGKNDGGGQEGGENDRPVPARRGGRSSAPQDEPPFTADDIPNF